MHEVDNAVDQTNRELDTRFDFKGSGARTERTDMLLSLQAGSEFQIRQMLDILHKKMAKRSIDIDALSEGGIETSGNRAKLEITVRQGVDQDFARKIVKMIKESKIRVQSSIQGEKVRVTGKKRDDLQEVIQLLRESKIGLPLQYINFRD